MGLSSRAVGASVQVSTDEVLELLPLDLEAVVASAHRLDPLPTSLARLATLVTDGDGELREIVEVVAFDQALTGALLSRANSAASAMRNPIRTVHEAVVRLGTGTVLTLAMSTQVAPRLRAAIPEYGLREADLWRHSVLASMAVDVVRRQAELHVPPEASTAALLHDVGKLVLARYLAGPVLQVLGEAREADQLSSTAAETAVLGIHHGELGGLVIQHWGLPDSIAAGVQYHHDPAHLDAPIGYGVHLANLIAHEVDGDRPVVASERIESMDALRIAEGRWTGLVDTVRNRFNELAARYG